MKICPKCNSEYEDDVKFCKKDGTPLTIMPKNTKTCTNCNAENPNDAMFCNSCGQKFGSGLFKCVKCGKEYENIVKFCNACGGKVLDENEMQKVIKEKKVEKSDELLKTLDDDFVLIKHSDMDSYYISKYQVTQELYYAVMKENPSQFGGKTCPVESVSWYDAIYFCNILSEKLGLEPVYSVDGKKDSLKWRYKPHKGKEIKKKVEQDLFANGYRLPSEEEWEFAAKGGENYRYAGSDSLDEVGWYDKNSGERTHPVGQKKPNGYGLYDMSGNVDEWCWEEHVHYGGYHSLRGGSWSSYDCQVTSQDSISDKSSGIGLRLVRSNS